MIPNLKLANEKKIANTYECTIGCRSCRRPLWKARTIKKKSPPEAILTPYPGVRPYKSETLMSLESPEALCPFCGKAYFAVTQADGHTFPVPTILENI